MRMDSGAPVEVPTTIASRPNEEGPAPPAMHRGDEALDLPEIVSRSERVVNAQPEVPRRRDSGLVSHCGVDIKGVREIVHVDGDTPEAISDRYPRASACTS